MPEESEMLASERGSEAYALNNNDDAFLAMIQSQSPIKSSNKTRGFKKRRPYEPKALKLKQNSYHNPDVDAVANLPDVILGNKRSSLDIRLDMRTMGVKSSK